MELADYRKLGLELYNRLRLNTFPVAARFIKDLSEIPHDAVRPSSLGQKWSLCQIFTHARRLGANIAMTAEDNFCLVSSAVHQWITVAPEDLLEAMVVGGYRKDIESETKLLTLMGNMMFTQDNFNKMIGHKGVIVSPLPQTIIEPQVILIFGTPAQLTHVIHALSYEGEYIIKSFFTGGGGSCMQGLLQPFLTDQPSFSNPGGGDRIEALVADDEVLIGLPAKLLPYVLKNLFQAGTGGGISLGQPLPVAPTGIMRGIPIPPSDFLQKRMDARNVSQKR